MKLLLLKCIHGFTPAYTDFYLPLFGLVILSLKIFLRTSPSALVFPTNNFVFVLYKFSTSLLISYCISLLWLPTPAHISAFAFLSPLQRLTISFRFLHLDPWSFTFVVCSLQYRKAILLFFYFLLCHVVEIMSKRTVPNLQCLKGDCLCCKEERERGLDAPARQMK